MATYTPRILVLGAAGLIGSAVSRGLLQDGFEVTLVARHFTAAQMDAFGARAIVSPLVDLDAPALTALLDAWAPDIVLNCIGVLQDGPRGTTQEAHGGFVERLLAALAAYARPALLVHLSVPGVAGQDATAFSRTKRDADAAIQRAAQPYAILRPGFVIAPAAYGGSALMRGLGALPFALPAAVAARPFTITAASDIVRTVSVLAPRWQDGETRWRAVWDVMSDRPTTVGEVAEAFRRRAGTPRPMVTLPSWLMALGARAGDAVARLGWSPPVRTTAWREMRRGVAGDPLPWMQATALVPRSLPEALAALPDTIQERWFGRLFMVKPLILGGLSAFWVLSGLVTLAAFGAAARILTTHGVPDGAAAAITLVTSLMDVAIGLSVAVHRTCRAGLMGGIALSLLYLASALLLTPELWLDPLGALVKTGPAIILMLVGLAVLDNR